MDRISPEAHDWFRGYYRSPGMRTQFSLVNLFTCLYTPIASFHWNLVRVTELRMDQNSVFWIRTVIADSSIWDGLKVSDQKS